MDKVLQTTVFNEDIGIRLDVYLAMRFNYNSRTQWQQEIKEGKILINKDIKKKPHYLIQKNDIIEYIGEMRGEPEVCHDYKILYQDEDLLAINKPGNLPIHPAGCYFKNTLLTFLQDELQEKLYPVHRLDRETSGIVLFARHKKAASILQTNVQQHKKEYLALVHGCVEQKIFSVDLPLGQAIHSEINKKQEPFGLNSKNAQTDFTKLYTFNEYTLLKAKLITGRKHQIRAHLLHLNFPIVGDKMYGLDEKFYLEFIRTGLTAELLQKTQLERSALHAWHLQFEHPRTKKQMELFAPLPQDIQNFMIKKGFHDVKAPYFR